MATYNKRGYKAPKPKDEKVEETFVEEVQVEEKDSTTAGVFNALDATASKTEQWVEKNQKIIFGVVGVIAIAALAWVLYGKFIVEPKEADAAEQMFRAQENFEQATNGTKADSLYALSLKDAEGKPGFPAIAEDFSGTKSANLAHYAAGIAYLQTGKFDQAIEQLEQFKSDDATLGPLAQGAIGDAYAEKKDLNKALEYYQKAIDMKKDNKFIAARFKMKAGKAELALGNKSKALEYFTDIKENYPTSAEAQGVDAFMGLAQ